MIEIRLSTAFVLISHLGGSARHLVHIFHLARDEREGYMSFGMVKEIGDSG